MSNQPPFDDPSDTTPPDKAVDSPVDATTSRTSAVLSSATSGTREWLDDDADDWSTEDPSDLMADTAPRWPMGLVAATVVALLLLGFGGYGVIQEREELREEISRLQAELATSAQPADTAQTRQALRRIERRNDELRASIANLELENQRLQASLSAQRSANPGENPAQPSPAGQGAADRADAAGGSSTRSSDKLAAPKPATRETGSAPTETNAGTTSGWFVNFSSYSQRSAAESWAKKLQPSSGTVTIVPGVKSNKTFYRVRVVGLASKAEASAVARALEREYKLSGLWVGEQ